MQISPVTQDHAVPTYANGIYTVKEKEICEHRTMILVSWTELTRLDIQPFL